MALVSKTITGFTGGVSQQAPAVRLDTQCEILENGFPTLVKGLIKRPPTEHIAALTSNVSASSKIHTINRDSLERYVAIFTGDEDEPIEVYTIDGTKCTVQYGDLDENLYFTARSAVKAYATDTNPLQNIKATTVADYTIVSNKTKKCAMDSTANGTWTNQALLYVKKGNPTCQYKVWLNGVKSADYTTGDTTQPGTYKTSHIATQLYNGIASANNVSMAINHTSPRSFLEDYFDSSSLTWKKRTVYYNYGYTLTLDGVQKAAVTWGANRTAEQAAIELAYQLSINLNTTWTVTRVGTAVYVKKTDNSGFTQAVGSTGANGTGLTTTPPTGTSEWFTHYISESSVMMIRRYDGGDFAFKAEDTFDGQSLVGIKEYVQTMQGLPPNAWEGFTCQVVGNANEKTDDFWVEYDTDAGKKTGVWKECVKPGIPNNFDKNTLPHRLVRTGINVFTFAPVLWEARRVGDTETTPPPSFIDGYINDIFFFRNRLGFLTGENLVLSKAGSFFNFWPSTMTDILDDDPIDVAVSSNQVSVLFHAMPFQKNLALFGDQLQFNVGSGENTLTPKTVAVDPTTYFSCSKVCKPLGMGNTIYFASPVGSSTTVREYYVDTSILTTDAADVTAHAPQFIPKNVVQMVGNDILETIFMLSADEPNTLYCYKYYWAGEEKKQSAWFKWTFDFDIFGIGILDNYLYIIANRDSTASLLQVDLEDIKTGSLGFRVHLDNQVTLEGVYSSSTGKTTWTLPYDINPETMCVVRSDTGLQVSGAEIGASANLVTVNGDYSGYDCYIGENYTKTYRFSPWFVKSANTNVADLAVKLKFRTITVEYMDSGYFRMEWQAPFRSKATKEWTGVILGQAQIGQATLHTGQQRFTVLGDGDKTTVDLVNDSYLPSAFQIASFEGTAIGRTQGI